METISVCARVPKAWGSRLDDIAASLGVSRGTIVKEAIAAHLQLEECGEGILARISLLENRVQALENTSKRRWS